MSAVPSDDDDDEEVVVPTSSSAPPRGAAVGRAASKPPRKRFVIINLSKSRYHIVRQAALELGWCIEDEDRPDVPEVYAKTSDQVAFLDKMYPHYRYRPDESPQVYWTDVSVLLPRVAAMKCFHRLNHFPSMHLLCRKMIFFSRCMKLRHAFPQYYTFFPKSFSLRTDEKALQDEIRALRGKTKTFLMKPNTGCQGRGIILTRNPVKVAKTLKDRDYIVQYYVHRPLLIDGKKFDMRVYVLMTMAAPQGRHAQQQQDDTAVDDSLDASGLQLFVHTEGLVRICSTPYAKPTAENLKDVCQHLTNYSVNKENEHYVFAGDEQSGAADGGEEGDWDGGQDLTDEGDGTEGFTSNKRDFRFLEAFVNQQLSVDALGGSSNDAKGDPAEEDEDDAVDGSSRRQSAVTSSSHHEGATPLTPWDLLLRKIDRAVVLSVLSAVHEVRHAYHAAGAVTGPRADGRNCFELMGFDILVTSLGQVHVLEINHSPSLFCDTALDVRIKKAVIKDTLRIATRGLPDLRKCSDGMYRRHSERLRAKEALSMVPQLPIAHGTGFRQVLPLRSDAANATADHAYQAAESQLFQEVWDASRLCAGGTLTIPPAKGNGPTAGQPRRGSSGRSASLLPSSGGIRKDSVSAPHRDSQTLPPLSQHVQSR